MRTMKFNRELFQDIILTVLSAVFCAAIIVMLAGCKTHKQQYKYDGKDYTTAVDSTAEVGHTEQVAKDSASTTGAVQGLITFADGGGTITTGGGVTLTGVQSVDGSVFGSGQVFHGEQSIHDTAFVAVHDTEHQTEEREEETETESKAQNYWWVWLIVGFVVGAGGIIAMKKIPYTK